MTPFLTSATVNELLNGFQRLLLEQFDEQAGCWSGHLSSSALSTAVAALALAHQSPEDAQHVVGKAVQWLCSHQNSDGGWGDTPDSPSNLSTTLLCWCVLTGAQPDAEPVKNAEEKCEQWIAAHAGGTEAPALQKAVLDFYGSDRTFSAPILTTCALAGRLGDLPGAWQYVPQLPFELAALPHRFYKLARFPVVSYALPALISVGLVRHKNAADKGKRWLHALRARVTPRVLEKLELVQASNGSFLEAQPLTGFVVLCLSGCGLRESAVVERAVAFLRDTVRPDGSWPIDTNLATWLTSLSVNSLADAENSLPLPKDAADKVRDWLLRQQHVEVHPYTNAAPGGWAWTDLAGGVPDADDTAGALLALHRLGGHMPQPVGAVEAGLKWLLQVQNSDGGIPTFCRGWGKLPFDRSCPDITAHALQAFSEWGPRMPSILRWRLNRAIYRGTLYLQRSRDADGCWRPLWFGNQEMPDHANPLYGTAQVVRALSKLQGNPAACSVSAMLRDGLDWILSAQDESGGWGAQSGIAPTVEETALAVDALSAGSEQRHYQAIQKGIQWIAENTERETAPAPSPIGLYFASLWYSEKLYPLIFAAGALRRVIDRF